MTNHVGQREQFVDNCGPQNEAQNQTHCAKAFKKFFDDELVDLIVRETNTQHKKYKPEISFHCVPECGTGNLSLQTKCMLC
jgi:DNA-directed RNA polymerase subunit M/transcription elongation factor TFIIS